MANYNTIARSFFSRLEAEAVRLHTGTAGSFFALKQYKKAIVNTYVFDDSSDALRKLRAKDFPEYDSSWLHFIMENRSGQPSESYDIIRGGVANDKVFNALELFFDGLISEEEALGRLKFERPNHQICICRQDLVDRLLVFQSSEEVSDGSQ